MKQSEIIRHYFKHGQKYKQKLKHMNNGIEELEEKRGEKFKDMWNRMSDMITQSTKKSGYTVYIPEGAKLTPSKKAVFELAALCLTVCKSEYIDDAQKLDLMSTLLDELITKSVRP